MEGGDAEKRLLGFLSITTQVAISRGGGGGVSLQAPAEQSPGSKQGGGERGGG